MNIAIYADRMEGGGGLETHIATQINELTRRDHKVHLSTNAISQYVLDMINKDNFSLYTPWIYANGEEDLIDFQPDIIHVHPFSSIGRGHRAAFNRHLPLFITMHGQYDYGVDRSEWGQMISRYAYKIIGVTDAVSDLLRQCTTYPEKVVTIYNGIDQEKFYPFNDGYKAFFKENQGLKHDKTLVILSRLADYKEEAIIQLLNVLPQIAEAIGGLNVIIVGSGNQGERVMQTNLSEIIACAKLNVRFVGEVSNVADFLNIADIVCACGRSALEAMACAKPVFAISNFGFGRLVFAGNQEEFITGISGYSWIKSDEIIKRFVNAFQTPQKLLNALGNGGMELISNKFSIKTNTDLLERLYYQALGGK